MVVVLNLVGVGAFVGCSKKVTTIPEIALPEKAPERLVEPVEEKRGVVFPRVAKAALQVQRVTLYFGFDKYVPEMPEFMKLDGFDYADRVVYLTGAACEIGPAEYNYNLGAKRAMTVRAYILQICPDADIRWKSVGEDDPVTNDPKQVFLNRRCEVEVR
jgi:outer membrane protein OmpA-like peptidoglycan-associated protein